MSYRIVMDSSANAAGTEGIQYTSAPLHISIDGRDFPDTAQTDMRAFNAALDQALEKGRPCSTACPSPHEWEEAFGDADEIYCITISRNLSGSYNSASAAKHIYEEQHHGRRVYVLDSFSTAGTMLLMRDHLLDLIGSGITGEEAARLTDEYRVQHTDILYTLQSMKRLAQGGRVSPLLVKAIGVLDLRIIGTASPEGTIVLKGKHRGASGVLRGTFEQMLKCGYMGGKVYISHNRNYEDAAALSGMIKDRFGAGTPVDIHETGALCSYYAEKGGYIIGFEK